MGNKREPHLLSAASLGLWWSLIRAYGGVQPRYWPTLAGILATSVLTAPLRVAERLRYGRQVAATEIRQAPVYIQGYGRSGTTHLHNVMAKDPDLGFMSTHQAVTQPFFLISRGWLERKIAKRFPAKRPEDNVTMSLGFPLEEEVGLAALTRLSFIHMFTFPARAREIMEKMGAMRLTEAELREWMDKYLHVLRYATLAAGGRRLVLKSPPNLGRADLLLRLFPDAKFIFLVRNPYVVFASNVHFYRTVIPVLQLQDVDWDEIEAAFVSHYIDVTRRYMRNRELIPKGNLIEVRFEDFEADPMGVLARIYAELNLPGLERARQPIAEYLGTVSGYRKNVYQFDQALIDKVDREWGFAVREWGYESPNA